MAAGSTGRGAGVRRAFEVAGKVPSMLISSSISMAPKMTGFVMDSMGTGEGGQMAKDIVTSRATQPKVRLGGPGGGGISF